MSIVKERAGVDKIIPYQPAKSLESIKSEYGLDQVIKLAGNENRLGCSDRIADALKEYKDQFSFYPDSNCTVLRDRLSLLHQVEPNQLFFGNGSFELIALIAHAYLESGEEAVIPDPSFGWYRNVTLQMNGNPVMIPLKEFAVDTEAVLGGINDKTKIIWICNPNNPTGTVLKEEELTDFIGKIPSHILVVLDEAYIDFVEEPYFETAKLVRQYKNVILLRTFSKLYGLASFRIGYGIADLEVAERINKIRSPLNVSFLAQIAAKVSLEDEDFKKRVLDNNRKSLDLYYSELKRLGLEFVRSNGNFILIRTGIDGKIVEDTFLKSGIIIRNASEFGLDGWIRVSVGTFSENGKVIGVLEEIIGQRKG